MVRQKDFNANQAESSPTGNERKVSCVMRYNNDTRTEETTMREIETGKHDTPKPSSKSNFRTWKCPVDQEGETTISQWCFWRGSYNCKTSENDTRKRQDDEKKNTGLARHYVCIYAGSNVFVSFGYFPRKAPWAHSVSVEVALQIDNSTDYNTAFTMPCTYWRHTIKQ